MKNNKFINFMKSIDYFKSILPDKYKNYWNVISKLYTDRKIEKQSEVRKLLDKLMSRGKGPQTAIKLIETKYNNKEPVKGIKQKLNNFFVTMEVERILTYSNQRNKEFDVKDKVLKSVVVKARNEDEAKIKASDEYVGSSNQGVDSLELIIQKKGTSENVNFIDIVNESSLKSVKPEIQWLQSSSDIVEYNFIPEERKFLNIKEKKCVEDNLYGIYHEHIKKITIEYIRNLASEYYKNDWTYEKGYTAKFIKYFCENHNISMYAFDITNKCFFKYVTKSHRKYPALFFYAMNNHMYLVKNEEKCKQMMEQAKDHENFNTSIVELKEKENIFNSFKDFNEDTKETTYRIEENIRQEDILNYESRIFMYSIPSRKNIEDIF